MPPIAIFEASKDSRIDVSQARKLCEKVGEHLHRKLKVPDPNDKESRVVSRSSKAVLRLAFTIGENEYPGFKRKSFFPTGKRIESAGRAILAMVRDSQIGVSQVVIEAWENTTFALREEEIPEPAPPITEEVLRETGSHLINPKIRLVLFPQKREGVSSLKELGPSPENSSYQEVVARLSSRLTEILGRAELITAEVEFADFADTDVTVEFDCELQPDSSIPQEVRKYMAESVLFILNSSSATKEGSGEVWIRQGQPEAMIFE